LLRVTARKNVVLTEKIRCMAKKTTREKILEYLTVQARLHGSREFTIPLNRQGLADYLSVDRSALSVEINKLKREEVIDTKGSWFKLQDC
jgi:CRP-like cAMP-binding protein